MLCKKNAADFLNFAQAAVLTRAAKKHYENYVERMLNSKKYKIFNVGMFSSFDLFSDLQGQCHMTLIHEWVSNGPLCGAGLWIRIPRIIVVDPDPARMNKQIN